MDQPHSPAPLRPPLSGPQRLVLAVSAAGAVVTLCWAGLQVRAAKDEARHARETLPATTPIPAVAPADLTGRVADLERRLQEMASVRQQAADDAAAQIKQRDEIIVFLRQENEAAQKTIKRLSGLESGPASPEEQPVQTNTLQKTRDR
jgi:hypothetical protein